MKRSFIVFLSLVMFMIDGESWANPCESHYECGADASGNYGCTLGSFVNFEAKSNGDWTGSACGDYQCVTFVKDFYSQIIQDPITTSWGDAKNAYDYSDPGLNRYAQDGTTTPQIGDILCFEKDNHTSGHVAIVTEVGSNYVKMIDQNRTNSSSDIILQLTMTVNNGHYHVNPFSSSYYTEGWLRDPDYNPVTYSCAWVSQTITPSGSLIPGQTVTCEIKYRNTGTATWSKTPGANYVELKSVNSGGSVCYSFFNYDPNTQTCYSQSVVDWRNCYAPCTMDEATRSHNDIATFNFTGKIRTDASPGTYNIYFAPIYDWDVIQGWDHRYYQIEVTAPAPSNTTFQSLTGKFTSDGYTDVCLYEDSPGDLWVSPNATTDNAFTRNTTKWLASFHGGGGYTALSGDIGGSDLDDVALLNRSLGRWFVAYSYGDHFSEAVGDRTGGMWLDDWGKSSVGTYTPFIADFNDDGYADACLYEAVSGNWYVALRDLTGNRFLPTGNPWITGYGDEVGAYQPIVGDFNADGYADAGLYKISNGNWYVAFNSHSNTFTRQGTTWITGFGDNGTFQALVGQYNGDDHSDIGLYHPSTGYWYVAFNYGDHFTKQNGPETYGAWIIDYGNGSAGQYRPLVGQFSWDAYSDIGLYQPEYGRWFVAILDGNPYRFTRTADAWLDGWGVVTGSPKRSLETEIPVNFSLYQNYPNPFNAQTLISYALPQSSHIRIDIYNILGQNVTTLIDAKQEAGEHQVIWNAGGQPSGVYFYRIVTEDNAETKKMLLLK